MNAESENPLTQNETESQFISQPQQKILIVDDKPANLFALQRVLRDINADVVEVTSGQEALEAVLEHSFSLMILDVQMPEMDGYELASFLQGDPKTKDIPIIFLTANLPDEDSFCMGYHSGAIDYITKPYNPEILLSKVNILLEIGRRKIELQQHRDHLQDMINERVKELNEARIAALNMMEDAQRAKDETEKSRARLQRAQEVALVGDWEINLNEGVVTTSQSAKEIYGVQNSLLTLEEIQKIPLHEYRPMLDAALHDLIHNGKPYDVQFTIRRPADQKLIEIHSVAEYNPKTKTVFGVIQDITKRIHTEKNLLRTTQLLTETQKLAKTGSWTLDLKTHELVWTDEAYRIFGVPKGEKPLTYEVFLNAVHPDDRNYVDEQWNAHMLSNDYDIEHRLLVDGNVKWVRELAVITLDQEGNPAHAIGFTQDITKQKELQDQLFQSQKLESIGQLAGGVAHDFNNQLMAILNYSEISRDELPLDHPVLEFLEEIDHAVNRSSNLTRQLLAFARKQDITPEIVDVNESLSGMLKMLRRLIGENIDLSFEPGPDVWPIKMDPSQIDQILANLCVNARDAIDEKGKISIKTNNSNVATDISSSLEDTSPGDYVLLSVSDDGTGMDAETQKHLFEPFYTTKEVGKGTGLGLATIHGIVKQNNGLIRVESNPGKGSRFLIYLPRFMGETASADSKTHTSSLPSGTETILVVEDEISIRRPVAKQLEKLGYTVLSAEGEKEAMHLINQKGTTKIDLLLTDVIMPETSGPELADNLTKMIPDLKCVYMSGHTSNILSKHGLQEEEIDLLEKPFNKETLAQKIRDVLDR